MGGGGMMAQLQKMQQQLADAQAALLRCQQKLRQSSDEHTAALLQLQTEAEERAAAAAESTCRIEELVHLMEQTHVDHVARVRPARPGSNF